ncbi:hypothetical protein Hanom_Chr06g00555421 [Helianthus anomalus]
MMVWKCKRDFRMKLKKDAEEISKFADALPSEWNEALVELKKNYYSFSRLTLDKLVNKLQEHGPQIVCSDCEKSKSENVKLLRDVESFTLENKNFIKLENDFKNQIKILENEKSVLNKNDFEKQNKLNSHFENITQLEQDAEIARKKIEDLEKKLKCFVALSLMLDNIVPKAISKIEETGEDEYEFCKCGIVCKLSGKGKTKTVIPDDTKNKTPSVKTPISDDVTNYDEVII